MVAHHRGNPLLFVFSLPLLCKSSELFKTWWVPVSVLFVCIGLSHLKTFWWSQESDETLFPHFQLSWLSICSSGLEKQLSQNTASGRIDRVLDYHDQNVNDCLSFHFVQGLKPLASEHAEMRLHEVLNELREKCRRQRLLMYPYFKDYDRVGTAYAAVMLLFDVICLFCGSSHFRWISLFWTIRKMWVI